jgi:hypothetical protein
VPQTQPSPSSSSPVATASSTTPSSAQPERAVASEWTVRIPGGTAPNAQCADAIPFATCRVFVDGQPCAPSIDLPLPCNPGDTSGCHGEKLTGKLLDPMSRSQRPAHPGACCYESPKPSCILPWMGRVLADDRGMPVLPRVETDQSDMQSIQNAIAIEWASVASFARASLELMSLGAPAELVRGVHEAALDEIVP